MKLSASCFPSKAQLIWWEEHPQQKLKITTEMAGLRAAVTADGGWNRGASLGPHSSRSAGTASPHLPAHISHVWGRRKGRTIAKTLSVHLWYTPETGINNLRQMTTCSFFILQEPIFTRNISLSLQLLGNNSLISWRFYLVPQCVWPPALQQLQPGAWAQSLQCFCSLKTHAGLCTPISMQ